MINSFLGVETLSRGLLTQQLSQSTLASNLAKTYRDKDGYVIASRQRLDVTTANPLPYANISGLHSLGQGPQIQQITRLRSFFLDGQIQRESQRLGFAEVKADILTQVNTILNTGTNTVNDALNNLAASFTALAAAPTTVGLRDAVVNNGVAFAEMARNQFAQLESLQRGVNGDISQTLSDINQILQEIHSVNARLMGSTSSNLNDTLDARDYAVTRLNRLLNVTTHYDSRGLASVTLGGRSLVGFTGAAQFDTNLINQFNAPLANIRLQGPQGGFEDFTSMIRGGRLGGQLHVRDVVLDGYKDSLDMVVHSILDTTNVLHRAGYAADGITTNISFFTGVSARDINVNASLVADPTRALVAASSRYGATANGEIAQFLGDLPNLNADDYIKSFNPVNFGGFIDPTQAIMSGAGTALNGAGSNSTNWNTPPFGLGGTFSVNSVNVTYANATDSLYDVLDSINAADPNVRAVFNFTEQKIYILSNNTTIIRDLAGSTFKSFTNLRNVISSTLRMNNGFASTDPSINPGQALNTAFNSQAYKVTPSANGTFVVHYSTPLGVPVTATLNFNNTQTLNQIRAAISVATGGNVGNFFYNILPNNFQELELNSLFPIRVTDTIGNFSVFTGLNGSNRLGNQTAALTDQVTTDLDQAELIRDQSAAALDQLNNSQANLAALSFSASEAGTPFEVEQANAVKALIAFNAALQAMQLVDKMLSALVSIVGGSGSSVFTSREG